MSCVSGGLWTAVLAPIAAYDLVQSTGSAAWLASTLSETFRA